MSARALVDALREPASVGALDGEGWTSLIAVARAEQLIGSLAFRVEGQPMPEAAARILADARAAAVEWRRAALWEAEMARRALAPLGVPVVLLKGTAYHAAGLDAATGRAVGDLDILVARENVDRVEAALLAAGWEWVKPDPYDDAYYRRWMHELPPLIHRARDRMIDVHHTILPLTARPKPDAVALIADSFLLEDGLRTLSSEDMIVHAAAHLFADGDLAGGLRNLWDIDRLFRQFVTLEENLTLRLIEREWHHNLYPHVRTALRLSSQIFGTPLQDCEPFNGETFTAKQTDRLFIRRLLARDGWGRSTRRATRFGFYARSHWLRMPPAMLARHLWTKWRRS